MAEESKTYVFDTAAKGSGGIDPNALLAMMNNNGGNGGWGNASWLWIVFIFFLYGWRGNGMFGGAGGKRERITPYTKAELDALLLRHNVRPEGAFAFVQTVTFPCGDFKTYVAV